MKGVIFYWCETGLEGVLLSFQDEAYIDKTKEVEGWDYKGLHVLKTGDYLKIFKEDGSVSWEGEIAWDHIVGIGVWPDGRTGIQNGFTQEQWLDLFVDGAKAELIPGDGGPDV
jgi:hypothetical protein